MMSQGHIFREVVKTSEQDTLDMLVDLLDWLDGLEPQPTSEVVSRYKKLQDIAANVIGPLANFLRKVMEKGTPRSLEKRASQALISHVDLPPERGSDGPSIVNICQPVDSDADGRHLPVTFPVLNWVAHPARSWAPLRRFFCSDVSCMPYR